MAALVVIGAGGHGREILDVLDHVNDDSTIYEVVGVLDDGEPRTELLDPYHVPFLGGVDNISQLSRDVGFVIGVGSPHARRIIDERMLSLGRTAVSLRHPTATLGRAVDLAPGTVLFPGVHLTNHIRLGRHVHVSRGATVAHDCVVGNYSFLAPHAVLSGNVTLGEEVWLGTGAVTNQGISVGDRAVIGSGAVVIDDVEADVTVAGVPAKRINE